MAEAGVKNVDVYSWQAVVAPKGLPADVRTKFHAGGGGGAQRAGGQAAVHLARPRGGRQHAGQFAAFQQQEFARWKKVIETGKITAD